MKKKSHHKCNISLSITKNKIKIKQKAPIFDRQLTTTASDTLERLKKQTNKPHRVRKNKEHTIDVSNWESKRNKNITISDKRKTIDDNNENNYNNNKNEKILSDFLLQAGGKSQTVQRGEE